MSAWEVISVLAANKAKQLSFAGISLALMLIVLLLIRVLPTADVFLYSLVAAIQMTATAFLPKYYGFLLYLASSILGFIFIGLATIFPYIIAYGLWIFVKLFIENLGEKRNLPTWSCYLMKGLIAAVFALVAKFLLVGTVIAKDITVLEEKLGALALLWFPATIIFILAYDQLLNIWKRYIYYYLHTILDKS